MHDWNMVVTVRDRGWGQALRLLRPLAAVEETHYYNVLLARAEDPRRLLDALLERAAADPEATACIARVVPVKETFAFQTVEEFEARARDAVRALAPALAGRSFHVRLHRRGMKGRLSSHAEEQMLAGTLLDALAEAGTPGRVAFEDPEAIVFVEIVGSRAGACVITRDERSRYPFLRHA